MIKAVQAPSLAKAGILAPASVVLKERSNSKKALVSAGRTP